MYFVIVSGYEALEYGEKLPFSDLISMTCKSQIKYFYDAKITWSKFDNKLTVI